MPAYNIIPEYKKILTRVQTRLDEYIYDRCYEKKYFVELESEIGGRRHSMVITVPDSKHQYVITYDIDEDWLTMNISAFTFRETPSDTLNDVRKLKKGFGYYAHAGEQQILEMFEDFVDEIFKYAEQGKIEESVSARRINEAEAEAIEYVDELVDAVRYRAETAAKIADTIEDVGMFIDSAYNVFEFDGFDEKAGSISVTWVAQYSRKSYYVVLTFDTELNAPPMVDVKVVLQGETLDSKRFFSGKDHSNEIGKYLADTIEDTDISSL